MADSREARLREWLTGQRVQVAHGRITEDEYRNRVDGMRDKIAAEDSQAASAGGPIAAPNPTPGPWAHGYEGAKDYPDAPPPEPKGFHAEGARRPFPAKASELVGIPWEAQAHLYNRPDDIAGMRRSQAGIVAGSAGGGLAGLALRPIAALAPEALQGVTQLLTAGGEGAAGGYTQGVAEGKADGQSWGDAHDRGVETGKFGAVLGAGGRLVGEAVSGIGQLYGKAADMIRGSRTVTGSDIRALEDFGSSPVPIPFKPTVNPPSTQLNREMPNLPERVTAEPYGRGLVAQKGAEKLLTEVEAKDRMLGQRFRNDEMPKAIAKQGDRQLSTQKYVDAIDARLADPGVDLMPGLRGQLEKARAVLAGELEPSMEIFTGAPRAVSTNAAPVDVTKTVTERPFVGPPRREVQTKPRDNWAGEDGLDGEVSGRAVTTGEPHETITVPTGDVRGRLGDSPNYVMSAEKFNRTRDMLDDAAGISSKETGLSKKEHELAKLANEMRGDVRREAPAIGLANRRFSAGQRKLEATRERMRTENDESLAMRIAGQDEQGAKAAGLRAPGLQSLRENFPTSEHLTRSEVDRVFSAPRALMAEERMKLLKPMGQIGGATKYGLNLQEPLVARGVYPSLRLGEESLALGGAATPQINNPVVRAAIANRERERERGEKLKSAYRGKR